MNEFSAYFGKYHKLSSDNSQKMLAISLTICHNLNLTFNLIWTKWPILEFMINNVNEQLCSLKSRLSLCYEANLSQQLKTPENWEDLGKKYYFQKSVWSLGHNNFWKFRWNLVKTQSWENLFSPAICTKKSWKYLQTGYHILG